VNRNAVFAFRIGEARAADGIGDGVRRVMAGGRFSAFRTSLPNRKGIASGRKTGTDAASLPGSSKQRTWTGQGKMATALMVGRRRWRPTAATESPQTQARDTRRQRFGSSSSGYLRDLQKGRGTHLVWLKGRDIRHQSRDRIWNHEAPIHAFFRWVCSEPMHRS